MEKTPLEHALDVSSSVFIQACAGAGKTFALTKRYAAILDDFAREAEAGAVPEQTDHKKILVITFTKKAAGEMRERTRQDISILLSGKEIPELKGKDFCPTLRDHRSAAVQTYIHNLTNTFSQNAISTIDSFCGGLIKEFAHKLDLDPQFALQEDAESQRFLDENLEDWLKKKVKGDPHAFDVLLQELNFEQIRRALKTLYGSREVLDEYSRRIEEETEEKIWREWLQRYTPDADIEGLAAAFEVLWNNTRSACSDPEDNLYKLLESAYQEYCLLKRNDLLEFRSGFLSIIRNSGFLTTENCYKKNLPGNKQNWEDKKAAADAWYDLLKTMVDVNDLVQSPGPQDKKIIPLLKELIALYRDFNLYYSERKSGRNVLDFSDVIIKTHELLNRHKDVRKQIGKRFRHIMLDEFQDTNPMRWEIIRMIFEAGKDTRLFIVGDRKQSIFRFNHADVTVMNKAEALVRERKGKILDFNDNYRSSEIFVNEGINPLIGSILPSKDDVNEAYEADFQPTRHRIAKTNITPALEMHWCNIPDEKDDSNYSALHAARHVRELLEKYQDSAIDCEGKPLIGVLFRKFTNIDDYLQVFRRFDIPFSIVGGKGFYNTPPLLDVLHFLSVLDNPFDDHALIALLRSPFIGLPDTAIHRLSERKNKDISLFEIMEDHAELRESRDLILSWIEAAGKMPPDELIAGILDRDYRELGYVSELLPQQQLANLDKAINIIRGMQRKGNTLREIREYFYYQSKQETPEAQALYPGTAKVHLLTIHKAKGLEYPIVIIPEMNSKGSAGRDNIRFGRSGGHAEISLALSDQVKPGLLLKLKEIGDREDDAEDKRIFYVALTRAVYKACFLGEGANKCEKNTAWYNYVLKPQGLIGDEDKALDPGDWPQETIRQIGYETLQTGTVWNRHETKEWKELPAAEDPGSYCYRSPHDLMGDGGNRDFREKSTAVDGLALGTLYHHCIEQKHFDLSACHEEIHAMIDSQFPDSSKKKLLEKLGVLLNTTKQHEIYPILQDPSVEKYQELPLKGWLKKDKHFVQVNGTLDLLYRQNGQWRVLDFKTDSTKDRLASYEKQLMTYCWMLKQAYGIAAAAKIFFVSLNETLDVSWSAEYFNGLPLGPGFRPALPDSHTDARALSERIGEGKHLLFCTSAHHEEQIWLSLVKSGKMRPDINVTTLSKWVASLYRKNTSQDRLRLMIQRSDDRLLPGTVDYLAKACREHEMQNGEIRPEFLSVYEKIKKDPAYLPADLPYRYADIRDVHIAFIDNTPADEPEKELMARLRLHNTCFDCSLLPQRQGKQFDLIEAFSPREEVFAVARHIRESAGENTDILITVSSMEKYTPHLKRIFPQMGLQVRFTDLKPLKEYPLSTLVLNVIRLSTLAQPLWKDLAAILLHPLMKADPELLRYDKQIRSEPWKERALPQEALAFIDKYQAKTADELKKKIEDLILNYRLEDSCGEDRVCEKLLLILAEITRDLQDMRAVYGLPDLYREMKTRVNKAGLPRKDQPNGIPVVGFLDSMGAVPERLYVMGMVEGEIPRPENENPCLNRKEKRSLELNRHFMDYWKTLGNRVLFTVSRHAEDGTEQNRSSFLQDLDLRLIACGDPGPRTSLLAYDSCMIRGGDGDIIRRHNEIVSDRKGIFSGRVNDVKKEFRLPVTSIDTLLACPQRFYYDRILELRLNDADESKHWAMLKGSVIHRTFEYFTKENGFALAPDPALALLKKCLFQVLDEEKISIEDPFQADIFRDYIRDLEPGSETNGLVKLLKEIHRIFPEYGEIVAEKDFEDFPLAYGNVKVYLRGRIDRLMIDKTGKRLVAADYKTGNITLSDLKKMLLSQLYLYARKCKADFPGYAVRAAYERVADAKNTKIHIFLENEGLFAQENSKKGNAFRIDEFEKHLEALFLQIAEGKYYLTERAFRDACKNCSHEGLCRKNSRMRNVMP
ncbi:MAG: UvrD-helicase domain-containing protein [Candidatus Marinimicrobia bacterium]|nr:UvrD-helicase domain-containing protein [Candidatus Neomarinimicrobiota bacterium]